jgi:hypothetical protein
LKREKRGLMKLLRFENGKKQREEGMSAVREKKNDFLF